jgi:uncharacterized repeat protein (TIGR01451 family)
VFYAHRFTPGSGGAVSFALAATTSPAGTGSFNQVLHLDTNCSSELDAGEPVQAVNSPVPVQADRPLCVIVKATVPSGAPIGAIDTATLAANFGYTNASPALAATHSNTDTTTVGEAGALLLLKSQSTAVAVPGASIVYTVEYRNHSSGALSNIVLSDATPAFTRFVAAQCVAPLPAGLSGCSVSAQPAAGSSGTIQWTLSGSLAPAARGQVQFTVQVD